MYQPNTSTTRQYWKREDYGTDDDRYGSPGSPASPGRYTYTPYARRDAYATAQKHPSPREQRRESQHRTPQPDRETSDLVTLLQNLLMKRSRVVTLQPPSQNPSSFNR